MREPSGLRIVCRRLWLRISGDRTWKHPLNHQQQSFAVWRRLPSSLPASPHGPFVVELFAIALISRDCRTGLSGFTCHQVKTPHAGQVVRSCNHNS